MDEMLKDFIKLFAVAGIMYLIFAFIIIIGVIQIFKWLI